MIRLLSLLTALCAAAPLAARQPLYLVNGEERSAEAVGAIDASQIETIDELPADEQTIARYGEKASGGVILVTLRYDTPAAFPDSLPFGRYIARRVEWADDEPAACVSLRYDITCEGRVVVTEILQSTDNRLRRRVLKAVAEAPFWTPARKNGAPVKTSHVLTVRLPEGKPMRGEPYIRMR